MVGNVGEWVADWVPRSTACPGWVSTFSDDFMCLAGADTIAGPGALIREGWSAGANAGVFSVNGLGDPSGRGNGIGFRCAR